MPTASTHITFIKCFDYHASAGNRFLFRESMATPSVSKRKPPKRRPETSIQKLYNDPKIPFAFALLLTDAVLTALIIAYVPYTKIDWDAYMSQVNGFIEGEIDYSNLKGDTGPLVYPAGFLYIYSAIQYVTGGQVYPAQILFGFLYIMNLGILLFLYVKTDVAEQDTDEVYAQITLLPEPNQPDPTSPDESLPEPVRPMVHSFCKVLTASDTSTHGGFSVLRKHANEYLPPLDMTQPTPTQELVAKDLRGIEWRFKHIFRGQPRRHLLTTGWSTFVTSKRLVAGDSFVFLRGENGELRVGVRRLGRQQNSMPSSVISRQSMHLGVLATASHAVSTQTRFAVYYKPRYGMVIFFNIVMWGCYVNSLKALSSLQATVTNFATNFLFSGLAGFFLFEEPLSLKSLETESLIEFAKRQGLKSVQRSREV